MKGGRNSRVVNIHEAKTTLSRLIERVLLGEEIMIAKNNVPVATLVALTPTPPARVLGSLAGQIHIGPDFDADDELTADFEGASATDPLRSVAYPASPARALKVAEGAPARRKRRP
ncbi:MAG: type II toxin-antitoxin system Phd/YefM family antitoxin [Gemmatimonadetes bacterium]|nr:type II toxin-antitoxin system Phd/YefM family antitoxin [Gemmatimonadota bacterium]